MAVQLSDIRKDLRSSAAFRPPCCMLQVLRGKGAEIFPVSASSKSYSALFGHSSGNPLAPCQAQPNSEHFLTFWHGCGEQTGSGASCILMGGSCWFMCSAVSLSGEPHVRDLKRCWVLPAWLLPGTCWLAKLVLDTNHPLSNP